MLSVRRIALTKNQDGRLELVATARDEESKESSWTLWHAWQTVPGGNWAGWDSLGEPPDGASFQRPAVARNTDGRLEAVVMGNDRAVWHAWQTTPGGDWTGWQSLGRPGGQETPEVSPALAQNQDGRLEVFTLANDSAVWHAWQTVPGDDWTGWHTLGTPSDQIMLETSPVLARNEDGRLEMFVAATDEAAWHRWQRATGAGPWAAWSSLGGIEQPTVESLEMAVGAHADGRLVLFAEAGASIKFGRVNFLQQREQTAPNNGWSPWRSFDNPPAFVSEPTLASDAQGRLELFLTGPATGGLYRLSQTTPDGTEWTSSAWPPRRTR